jgi:hypothetical protein
LRRRPRPKLGCGAKERKKERKSLFVRDERGLRVLRIFGSKRD